MNLSGMKLEVDFSMLSAEPLKVILQIRKLRNKIMVIDPGNYIIDPPAFSIVGYIVKEANISYILYILLNKKKQVF